MNMSENPDRPLTVEEAAELLSVAKQTLYNWVCSKRIPHVKLSRSVLRFRRVDLLDWLDGHAVPSNERDTTTENSK